MVGGDGRPGVAGAPPQTHKASAMTEPTCDPNRRQAVGLALMATLASSAVASPTMAALPSAAPDDDLRGPWTGGGDVPTVGGSLHYATLGPATGEPLVLLPKLGGWIADWRFAGPYLAKNRRVIAFDLPGHGESRMSGPPPYLVSVPEVTAMILAALDDIGVERFSFAGNSLGGIVGMVAAACWPDRVSKLVIVSASMIGPMTRAQIADQDAHPSGLGAPSSYGPHGEPLPATDEQNRAFATTDPRVIREQTLARVKAGPWLRACERGVGRVGVTNYMPRIQCPTLLINTDRGRYAKYAEVGRRLIPHTQSVVIPGAGSFVHQERPAEVAAAMNTFLDGGATA